MRSSVLIFVFIGLISFTAVGQSKENEWQLGYFTPYFTNLGSTVGYAFDLKVSAKKEELKNQQRLRLLTQLGYFAQTNVSQSLLFNPELVYKWNRLDKRFFLTSSVGAGYLLSFQRNDGTLNLATGKTEYGSEAVSYFLPNLNLGFGVDPKKHLGFYFKATYGAKLSPQHANAAFFGIATGLIFKFNSKD